MGLKEPKRRAWAALAALAAVIPSSCLSGGTASMQAGTPRGTAQYSVVEDGVVYGARPDSRGPIGGGAGYLPAISDADYTARTKGELLSALKDIASGKASGGKIFIPGDSRIEFRMEDGSPDRIRYADGRESDYRSAFIQVVGSTTIFSDRGKNGSAGAEIRLSYSTRDPKRDQPGLYTLMNVVGGGAKISGLRIIGFDSGMNNAFGATGEELYRHPLCCGINLGGEQLESEKNPGADGTEIENCEVSGWSWAAVYARKGRRIRVHHCWVHGNQQCGLGYGIAHDDADSEISYNVFEDNRHSIQGTGMERCSYNAHDNVELGGPQLQHCFDMHGDSGPAGNSIVIENNTFLTARVAIWVRGVPIGGLAIRRNVFSTMGRGDETMIYPSRLSNCDCGDNLFGGIAGQAKITSR